MSKRLVLLVLAFIHCSQCVKILCKWVIVIHYMISLVDLVVILVSYQDHNAWHSTLRAISYSQEEAMSLRVTKMNGRLF